jgi:hypothetical protein
MTTVKKDSKGRLHVTVQRCEWCQEGKLARYSCEMCRTRGCIKCKGSIQRIDVQMQVRERNIANIENIFAGQYAYIHEQCFEQGFDLYCQLHVICAERNKNDSGPYSDALFRTPGPIENISCGIMVNPFTGETFEFFEQVGPSP